MKHKNILLGALFVAATSFAAGAETPLWLRYAKISPDGKEIAFCYKGDIYKVPVGGGDARQLTTQSSYETEPVWSPDGKQIAFATDRNGNLDVYVMSSDGGRPKRLTSNSSDETPCAFTPDGKNVVFSANIQAPAKSALFPKAGLSQLYEVPVTGGKTEQILGTPALNVSYAKDGSKFLYQDLKGFENEWRKHHTSSITRDVWVYDTKTGKHTNLTDHAGEDRNPVLASDQNTVYFLSERNGGSFNVYQMSLSNPKNVTALTNYKLHPVRFLSASNDGTLCYTYAGEIYTKKGNAKPQKVNINLVYDDDDDIEKIVTSSGASSAVVSPDGTQIAFIYRGDVFVTSTDYTTTKRITNTPATERGLSFSPDGKKLAYATERNGNWQLVVATMERKEDMNFPNATLIKEEIILPSSTVERAYPTFSPDGKELAFIEDRNKLKVVTLSSKNVRQVTDGSMWFETSGNFEYAWSPNGKWFAITIIGHGREPYTDVAVVSSKGGEVHNITNSGYFSSNVSWVMDGNALMYETNRYGMRSHASWGSQSDIMLAFFNEKSYDEYCLSKEDLELKKELEKEQKKEAEKKEANKKKKDDKKSKKSDSKKDDSKKDDEKKDDDKAKDVEMNFTNIEDRTVRLTNYSSDIANEAITKDGETLYYLSRVEKGYDLWKVELRKHSTQLLKKLDSGWASMQLSKDGKKLFILSSRSMSYMSIPGESVKNISYKVDMKVNLADERKTMFDHMYRQVGKRFYDTKMHGVDWDAMYKYYGQFLPHINNNYDYSQMLSEMLGELNVSHTGCRYYPDGGEGTANLGLLFDWSYTGKGLKIDEVVEKGPFNRASSKVKAGDIVEKVDGEEITPDTDLSALLTGKAGKKTLISFYSPNTKKRWDEVVLPISNSKMRNLLYDRWVKQRAEDVKRWSNGRLGYVHIASMNDASYREVYSDILGKYNKCDGIVIDTRFNGGGRLHEDIEILFTGKKYLTQVIRGRESCDMPSRRWNKPSIMLQCEANYSNAHGTPWVYKTRGIGKLVGMPVPGTMTSVSWETMQDNSLVFGIPIIGYRTEQGNYLENSQLEPDIKVANDPATIVKGEDTQLKTAVDELLREIDAKKK